MNLEGMAFGLLITAALAGTLYKLREINDFATQGPWFVLGLLAVGLSIVLFFKKTPSRIPYKESVAGLIAIAVSFTLSSLWNHSTFLEERWIQRYVFFLLAFLILQFSNDRKSYLWVLCFTLIPYSLWVCTESIYQFFLVCRPNDPLERSCFAGNFGNINMLSQYLVFCLPLILYLRRQFRNRWAFGIDLLIVLMISLVLLSSCRSSILSILALFILEMIRPWAFIRKKTLALAFMSGLIFLGSSKFVDIDGGQGATGAVKEGSARYRLQIWQKTFEMGIDHPMGAGVNNFEFGFLPYKLTSSLAVESREVDKSPHNEFLRLFSEDGWLPVILLLSLLGIFLFRQIPQFFGNPEGSFGFRYLICCLPEFTFQFPTDMWSPTLLTALAIPLIYEFNFREIKFPVGLKVVLFLSALTLPSLIWIRQVQTIPAEDSSYFCQAFPDSWKMCGEYFKVHFEKGDFNSASETIAPVIRRQAFNFIALHFDFLLGNPEHNQTIACNYWNLFRGQGSIPGSDISRCQRVEDRDALMSLLSQYAQSR